MNDKETTAAEHSSNSFMQLFVTQLLRVTCPSVNQSIEIPLQFTHRWNRHFQSNETQYGFVVKKISNSWFDKAIRCILTVFIKQLIDVQPYLKTSWLRRSCDVCIQLKSHRYVIVIFGNGFKIGGVEEGEGVLTQAKPFEIN